MNKEPTKASKVFVKNILPAFVAILLSLFIFIVVKAA